MADSLNVKNVWYILQRFAQKHNVQKYTLTDFNNHLLMAHYDHFKNVFGRQGEQFGYENHPVSKDALLPFKEVETLTLTEGEATLPVDYFHVRSVYTHIGSRKIKIKEITDEEWDEWHDNTVYYPTERDPVFNLKDNTTIRVSPNSIQSVEFYYLKRLTGDDIPKLDLSFTSGVMSYNSGDSVELPWDDDQVIDIIRTMLGYLSIEAGRGDVLQYVEQKESIEA